MAAAAAAAAAEELWGLRAMNEGEGSSGKVRGKVGEGSGKVGEGRGRKGKEGEGRRTAARPVASKEAASLKRACMCDAMCEVEGASRQRAL